jgi:hypothetical protein
MGPALRVDGPHSTPGPPLESGTLARAAGVRNGVRGPLPLRLRRVERCSAAYPHPGWPNGQDFREDLPARPGRPARSAPQPRVSERAMTALAARWKPVTTASRVSWRSRETVCSIWAACSGDCPEARAVRR